ncbi:GMC oxidoreductase [Microbacterium jiangjiandongii]|uniref:GMC oxidoreductase n=1 Tax=Microbacterium jiangjiandongii TaxID=3049071 RepID=UPI00214D0E7B|nr:GMC oxidoreductase [Microbacterium sp. zg.Y843]MCR2815846.1 FAD-dependent oxidoreductase [Microbacterium sp. zg.Y843]
MKRPRPRVHRPQGTGYDCVVVGAGPVGLALAMAAAEAGSRVLLVDAGNLRSGRRDVALDTAFRTEIADPVRHADASLTTRRGVGGTSWLWGGRCVTLEPIDFEPRDYVPLSDWPIRVDDVAPWLEQTARYIDCGSAVFRSSRPDWRGLSEFTMSNLERWSRQPKLARGLGSRVIAHPRVTVLLDCRLVDIDIADDGSVAGLVAERDGERLTLHGKSYVLAMGGLEVTRALLDVQSRHPHLFGGVDGPLGRYYMGHATGSIADIVLTDAARAADLDFERDEHDTYIRRRFTLTPEAQRRHRVLNTSFYLDNPPFYEHTHRHPTLSAVFLGIAIAPLGRMLLAEGIRLRHVGPRPYRLGPHVRNILRRPWRAAVDVLDILLRRYASRVRKPGFILHNDGGRYSLHYHAEQLPNPDSRVVLGADGDGSPVLRVDYRYLEDDVDSLLRCHELLDAELQAAGLGRLEYRAPDDAGVRALAWEQATDGFHSIGTTRMSADPAAGVTDGDCRVHGVANLYIASTSLLPTSAEANPTFFAAALAVRLAHHLAEQLREAREARHAREARGAGRTTARSGRSEATRVAAD